MSGAGNPKKAAPRAQIASFWVSTPWACEEIKAIPRVGKGDQIRSSLLTGLALGKLDPKLARLIGEFGGEITVEQLLMLLKVCFPDEPALRLVGNVNFDDVRSFADSLASTTPETGTNDIASGKSNFAHPLSLDEQSDNAETSIQPQKRVMNSNSKPSDDPDNDVSDGEIVPQDSTATSPTDSSELNNKSSKVTKEKDKKSQQKGSDWTKSLAG